jgi:N-dimethylarginine dimethylaminohydrolase
MCVPDFFGVDYVINPWMKDQVGKVERKLAIEQWNNLRRKIAHLAEVVLIPARAGLPDMVFTANAGFNLDKITVLSKFKHEERRYEEEYFVDWFMQNDYLIMDWPYGVPFEGAGDALYDSFRNIVWFGHGWRSGEVSSKVLERTLGRCIFNLNLVDERFYHLDTCFCPLSHGYIMYYPGAFDEKSLNIIRKHLPSLLIEVSEEDALNFACNAVEIHGHVIMNEATGDLQKRLRDAGFDPIITPLSEFLKAGGSAKCLTLRIDQ